MSFQMEVEPDVSMQNLTVDHNLLHGFRNYDDEIKGSDYVEEDPLFVNAPNADFHLQQNSPAIDSGSSIGAPANDYEGNTRPRGSGYDIGAYEYVTNGGVDREEPFGQFDTPLHGSTVRSSVPVTGWALDDVAVTGVKIYRDPVSGEGSSNIYIGDAVLVEGARPDVEAAFPGYPNNSRAGWGYMMLTNFLPNNGNGTFTLYAIASDSAGHQVTLGSKTITCDNANAVKPFGAIDTPTQGGTASGSSFINWGWVLTPMPNSIPTDGSTINVYVDGVNIGHPVYNVYRKDIATLFPGYTNSNGAVGYFYLDTTAYADGVHTIQWTAADNAGNTDGIGSRYFTIQNTVENRAHSAQRTEGRGGSTRPPIDIIDISTPVKIKKGYNQRIKPKAVYPDEKGKITIEIKELERLEIHFFDPEKPTSNLEHQTLNITSLPIGSFLDTEKGVLYWQPGPGFVGEYKFVFLTGTGNGRLARKHITVKIVPRF
jgi:hypothetical protein